MSDRAEELYGPKYLSTINDDPMALNLYAIFWGYKSKNLGSALKAIERACEIDKENPLYWAERAEILNRLNRPEEALKSVNQAISLEISKDQKEKHEPLRKKILEALAKKK